MPYITTSRKASQLTRRLVRSLTNLFSGSVCENRGKRSFDSVLKRASKLGFKNIILVYEFHGNPSELQPYTITKEGWEKKSPIKFNPILIEKIPKEGYNVEFKGNCFEIKEIFDDDFSEQYENKAVLSIDDTHLRITSNEKELIVLKLVK